MPHRILTTAFAVCLFTLVVAAKWATFGKYGSPMPDWDQWDAEGGALFIPWHKGEDLLPHVVRPHNEHRVILTKLQNHRPPHSRIDRIIQQWSVAHRRQQGFRILAPWPAAPAQGVASAAISPDLAICRHCLRELADAGVDQFNIYLMNGDEEAQLEIWAREIIPAMRAASSAGA